MEKVTLTRVFRKNVDTRYGTKPQLSVQTNEHGDKWLSTFKIAGTESWEVGQTVEMDIVQKGNFLNFTPVVKASVSSDVDARLIKLEEAVFGKPKADTPPDIEFGDDDLPDMGTDDGF